MDEGHLSQQGFLRNNVHDVTLTHLLIHGRAAHTLSLLCPSSAPFGGTFPLKGGRLAGGRGPPLLFLWRRGLLSFRGLPSPSRLRRATSPYGGGKWGWSEAYGHIKMK